MYSYQLSYCVLRGSNICEYLNRSVSKISNKRSFYRAANTVVGKAGRTASKVTLQLILSKCVSVFSERELTFTFAICRHPSVCSLSSVCLSVVCNVRAPYSGDWNFRQCFYAVWYLSHPWPFSKKINGDGLRGTSPSGELNTRGVAEYSDFGLIERYISETVQDRS